MDNDTLLSFDLPGIARKKLSLAFDGGRLSLDGGVLLSREAERDLRLAERLAYVCFRADSGPCGVTGWMSGDSHKQTFRIPVRSTLDCCFRTKAAAPVIS